MSKTVKIFTAALIVAGLISGAVWFAFDWFGAPGAEAAPPTVVAVGAVANAANAITPGMPAGVLTNDILLLLIETADQAITVSGGTETWTQITGSPVTGATGTRLTAFWARASQNSPTSPTTSDSGDHQLARIIAFRGVTPVGNPWDVVTTSVENVSDTSVSFPSVTTTVANTLVVNVLAGDGPDGNSTTNLSGWTNANLTGLLEQIDNRVNSGNGGLLGASTGTKVTAGATGATTATLANAAVKAMMTIALKPNQPPTFSISQPDGVSDTIAQNGSYSVTYTLSDSDNVVTAALYYDTDNTGLNGVAISGCGAVAEGTGATCTWNTTGVSPGTYYVYGITNDGVNPQVSAYSTGVVTINTPPSLSISQPDGVSDTIAQDASFTVTYTLSDPDNIVTAALYYDTNNSGLDGTAISGCGSVAEGTNVTCSWNTTGVTPGSYYVYGITNDGTNPQVSAYSTGVVTINARPVLSVSQPDGVGDTVTQGSSFNVTYSLADSDNTVTAAFYYDTNNSGLDGTAISGACATAAEGSNVTCSWNTTGVTPGSYYVYGITNDGTNAQVSAYSSGTITINAPVNTPPSLSISQPDGVGDSVTVGDSFNVTYSLSDPDNVVTAAFYYDTNNSGLDGTAITGACATAVEGTGVTCSWNTTGVTPGSYYVYGITNDGTNPQVSAYSSGTLTVNAVPVISISSVTPNGGGLAGGTNVTVSGTNFQSGATVKFGGVSATDVVFVDSSTITAKTPAHAAGMVDVLVTNPDLTSDTLVNGFTYTNAAVVSITASPVSVIAGESFIISWSTENATSCTAADAWSGAKAVSGNETITPTASGTYTLNCTGVGGSGSGSVSVLVSPPSALKEPGTLFTFAGFAYPDSKVFVYDNHAPFTQLLGDIAGRFATSFRLIGLAEKHLFSVIAYDKEGNPSPSKTFPSELYARGGLTDVLLAPTISLRKRAFSSRETMDVWGYATPGNKVKVEIDGKQVGTVSTRASGYYTFATALSAWTQGDHAVRSTQIGSSQMSDYSLLKPFRIGESFSANADLNNDGVLTVNDWSIFLSSWSSHDASARHKIDFNGDGKVTIYDLSVFLSNFRKR